MADFSIANNLSANAAELQLESHEARVAGLTRKLSSGLRIESAADDPSGLAISEGLLTRVDAFKTATRSVTTAQNAAVVADGALFSVTNILLRIRTLAVQGASTITSDSDRSNLQAEIANLLIEINRISQNTSFNGQALLDGSHAGFAAAVPASFNVTSNSVLASAGPNVPINSPSGLLLASASFSQQALQPTIVFRVLQNVTASAAAQTVKVSDAGYIQAGSVFSLDGQLVHVQSVDAKNGTITAIFSTNVANKDVASPIVNATSTAAVAAGMQIMTLSGSPQPLYAGEVLQVDYGSFATNDVVVVQKVLGPNTFVATFTKSHAAGAPVFNINGTYLPANYGPGNFTFNFGGAPTDGAPIGSTAYVVESTSGAFPPPNGSTTQVVATGTIVGGSVSSETINFPTKVPNYFGGAFEVWTALGLGTVPLTTTQDGTIKLQVVNTGVSIAVQETFYDTATQTSTTSPYLLAPGEEAMLYDGVVTTIGNVTAADVGASAYIKVHQATAALSNPNAPAFSIQSGAEEGDALSLGIPSVTTQTLRLSTVTVAAANGNDPALASQDTIGQVDYALQTVLGVRAQLGASMIRLQEDSNNDDTAAIGLQASESTIRDANVGETATELMREQTEVQVGLQILSQANSLPEQILKLFR